MGGGASDSQMLLSSQELRCIELMTERTIYDLQIQGYTWISKLERNRLKTSGLQSAELLSDFMGRNPSPSRECSGNNWVQVCRAFRRI
jgi:hypothetical protein